MDKPGDNSGSAQMAPLPPHPRSPVDELEPSGGQGGGQGSGLAWTAVSLASVAAVLALLNGAAAQRWVATAPVDQVSVALSGPAEGWARVTARIGLDAPRSALNRLWTAAQDARFPTGRPPISDRTGDPRSRPPAGVAPSRAKRSDS